MWLFQLLGVHKCVVVRVDGHLLLFGVFSEEEADPGREGRPHLIIIYLNSCK